LSLLLNSVKTKYKRLATDAKPKVSLHSLSESNKHLNPRGISASPWEASKYDEIPSDHLTITGPAMLERQL
jgi:hypothetical protein